MTVSTEVAYGGGGSFHDLSAAVAAQRGSLAGSFTFTSRDFDQVVSGQPTVGLNLAYPARLGAATVCPLVGFGWQRVLDLTVLTIPVGAHLGLEVPLGESATLMPFLEPAIEYARSSFLTFSRWSPDPFLAAGATFSWNRLYTGAAWMRRFEEGVPGQWRVSLGWTGFGRELR